MSFNESELSLVNNGEAVEASVINRPVLALNARLGKFQGINQINGSDIANESIPHGKLGPQSVSEDNISDSSITTNKIQNVSIENKHIKNNTIEGVKFRDASVDTVKIQNNQVTNSKLQNNSVQGDKIQNNGVNLQKLQRVRSGSVLGARILYDANGDIMYDDIDVEALDSAGLVQQMELGTAAQRDVSTEEGGVLEVGSFNIGSYDNSTIRVLLYRNDAEDPLGGDDIGHNLPYSTDNEDLKDLPSGFYALGPDHSQNPIPGELVTLIVTMHADQLATFIAQSVRNYNGSPRIYIQNTYSSSGTTINWMDVTGSGGAQSVISETITIAANGTKDYNLNTILGAALNAYDLKTANINVTVLDNTQGSPTQGMYINSEAVLVIGQSQNYRNIKIHNARDVSVSQRVDVTIGRQ